jgi:hypothetical protein
MPAFAGRTLISTNLRAAQMGYRAANPVEVYVALLYAPSTLMDSVRNCSQETRQRKKRWYFARWCPPPRLHPRLSRTMASFQVTTRKSAKHVFHARLAYFAHFLTVLSLQEGRKRDPRVVSSRFPQSCSLYPRWRILDTLATPCAGDYSTARWNFGHFRTCPQVQQSAHVVCRRPRSRLRR